MRRIGCIRWPPRCAPSCAGCRRCCVHLAELDVLRSEGEALVGRLREAGVAVETETFPGVVHGFLRAMGTVGKARDAVAKAGAWLRRLA